VTDGDLRPRQILTTPAVFTHEIYSHVGDIGKIPIQPTQLFPGILFQRIIDLHILSANDDFHMATPSLITRDSYCQAICRSSTCIKRRLRTRLQSRTCRKYVVYEQDSALVDPFTICGECALDV